MFDNQTTFTLENDDVWIRRSAISLYHPLALPATLHALQRRQNSFDEGLLADFDRQDLRFPQSAPAHDLPPDGQHVAYRNRFPAEAGYFTADSIPEYSTRGCGEAATNAASSPTTTTPSANDRKCGRDTRPLPHTRRRGRLPPTTARRCSITPTATDASTMRRFRPTAAVTNTRFLHDLDVGPLSGRTSRTRGGDRPCGRPALHDRRPAAPAARSGRPPAIGARPDAQRRQRPFPMPRAPDCRATTRWTTTSSCGRRLGKWNEQGCLIHSQTPFVYLLREPADRLPVSIFPPRRNGSPRPNAVCPNHVVLGGMMLPVSAMSISCFIETG